MDKKILGIRVGTILQLILCVVLSFVIWFIVQYMNINEGDRHEAASAVRSCLNAVILR